MVILDGALRIVGCHLDRNKLTHFTHVVMQLTHPSPTGVTEGKGNNSKLKQKQTKTKKTNKAVKEQINLHFKLDIL